MRKFIFEDSQEKKIENHILQVRRYLWERCLTFSFSLCCVNLRKCVQSQETKLQGRCWCTHVEPNHQEKTQCEHLHCSLHHFLPILSQTSARDRPVSPTWDIHGGCRLRRPRGFLGNDLCCRVGQAHYGLWCRWPTDGGHPLAKNSIRWPKGCRSDASGNRGSVLWRKSEAYLPTVPKTVSHSKRLHFSVRGRRHSKCIYLSISSLLARFNSSALCAPAHWQNNNTEMQTRFPELHFS